MEGIDDAGKYEVKASCSLNMASASSLRLTPELARIS